MAVDPISAGIVVGGGAISGLFQAAAERKRQLRELGARKEEQGFQTQTQALQQLSASQQSAFNNLISNFGKALNV